MTTATELASQHQAEELEDHDRGLGFDLPNILSRRRMLTFAAGAAGLVALAACGSDATSASTTASAATTAGSTASGNASTTAAAAASGSASTTAAASGDLVAIPEETNGPYPADGTNGKNVLTESGIVRSDIRSSFGSSTTTAEGVPATINFEVLDVATGQPVEGAAVYTWHCDRDGQYSMYSRAVTNENYLRGVQATDANGVASFISIYPACYSGRWPHIHFEVYPSVESATSAGNRLTTSQIALPDDISQAVFATPGYEQSVRNYAGMSLATDNVFSDGAELELATATGDVDSGYVITLRFAVST